MKDKGPLKGIKVVDLTAMVSGPTANLLIIQILQKNL